MLNVLFTLVYRNKVVEGDWHSLGESVMVLTFVHSPHPGDQSTGLVAGVYIEYPSYDGPADCHTRGRQKLPLCIRWDMTVYPRACIRDPHQFAL